MASTDLMTAVIGFGEAAQAFVAGQGIAPDRVRAFDIKTDQADLRAAKADDYARAGVTGCASADEAVVGAPVILSLVTADQVLAAAGSATRSIAPGALFLDMNSVAPQTKRAAAALIEEAGGRYVDVAVMAPVLPGRTATPLLVGGPHRDVARAALEQRRFTRVDTIDGAIGAASAVKMVRSVMIKGMEALSAECLLAAELAGVRGEVIASLDAGTPDADWARRLDYNLDRMLVHGTRRAAEMDEVVKTLEQLGIDPVASRATAEWQRALGRIGRGAPDTLDAKLALISGSRSRAA